MRLSAYFSRVNLILLINDTVSSVGRQWVGNTGSPTVESVCFSQWEGYRTQLSPNLDLGVRIMILHKLKRFSEGKGHGY
jgi:hypothetical protein